MIGGSPTQVKLEWRSQEQVKVNKYYLAPVHLVQSAGFLKGFIAIICFVYDCLGLCYCVVSFFVCIVRGGKQWSRFQWSRIPVIVVKPEDNSTSYCWVSCLIALF